MWYYLVAHVTYHFTRWFPKDARTGVCLETSDYSDTKRMFCIITSLVFLIPQFVILMDNESSRYCNQPLLNMLVASIMMSATMIAFTFLFTMMEPVPWKLKIGFHFFGFFSMIMGLIQFGVTVGSIECNSNTPQLYYLSLALGIFAFVATLFVTILLPFWMINYFWPNTVLNRKERRGLCYEPVKCCSCLWHV